MNINGIFSACIALSCFTAYAQDGAAPTNATQSSLKVSSERSQQLRVKFLFDAAEAYTKEQNTVAAVEAYEQILLLDSESKEAAYRLSLISISTKDYRRAESLLLELIEAYPDDYTLRNNLAWIYATAEDPGMRDSTKAIEYAQSAMVIAPTDYHIWSTLSEAYYTAGDYEKAYRAIKQTTLLASRYGNDLTEASVEDYNEQVIKCQRALDTANAMKDETEEEIEEETEE